VLREGEWNKRVYGPNSVLRGKVDLRSKGIRVDIDKGIVEGIYVRVAGGEGSGSTTGQSQTERDVKIKLEGQVSAGKPAGVTAR
jgi:hypothetical protein